MSDENKHPGSVAVAYLEAVSRKDFKAFEGLLAPDVTFRGPAATLSGAPDVSAAYQRLVAMLLRNDLKKMFVDGNDVCLIYDFVTDTSVGAVPTMEWLTIEDGKVRAIRLLTDHVRWPAALEELGRRARR
jgi:ketosteroid isomerase-like protein